MYVWLLGFLSHWLDTLELVARRTWKFRLFGNNSFQLLVTSVTTALELSNEMCYINPRFT